MQHTCMRSLAVAGILLAALPIALASISDPALVVTASNASGTATLSIPQSAFAYDPGYGEWDYFGGMVDLYDGTHWIARIKDLTAFLVDDPTAQPVGASITLQYTVVAGTSLTNFTVDARTVSLTHAIRADLAAARMSDSFVLTDLNNDPNAYCRALNNAAYKTYYGQAGSPNEFYFHGSDSLGSIGGNGQGAVYTVYDNWPMVPGDYESLGVAVDRIRTVNSFSVTASDQVKVLSDFYVVPEPAVMGLVSMIAVLLLRPRR